MQPEDISKLMRDYAAVLSLLTFLLGLLLGNWLALGRDKRKEFNQVSEEAFLALKRQISAIDNGTSGTSVGDLSLVESYIAPWFRGAYRNTLNKYREAHGHCTYDAEYGTVTYDEDQLVKLRACAHRLQKYLKRR